MKSPLGSSFCSYQEPTQVPLGEKPKASGNNRPEGTRQNGPVPSEEGVPTP